MRNNPVRFKALVLGILLSCVAFSQVNDRKRQKSEVFSKREGIKNQVQQAVWHAGAWSFSPYFNFGKIGYDSNLFSDASGEEVSDFLFSPEFGLKTYYRFSPRLILSLKTAEQYIWYKDHDELRSWNPDLSAHIHGLFKRLYLEAGVTFARDLSRLNTETIARTENERTTFSASGLYQLTARNFLRMRIAQTDVKYTNKVDALSQYDRHSEVITTSYIYKKTPAFWPFVEYERRKEEYTKGAFPYETISDSFKVGARNDQGGRWHYLGKIGVKTQNYDFYTEEGTVSLTADDLEYRLYTRYNVTRHIVIEAGVNQNVIFSLIDDYSHYLSQRTLLGISWVFSNQVELGPDVYFGTNDYQVRPGSTQLEFSNDYLSSNLNLALPLAPRIKLTFSIGYEDRELATQQQKVKGWYSFMDVDYRF
jgi:hypothetical protein